MPLDKGQRKRLHRSRRRAEKAGRDYNWPGRRIDDVTGVYLPNWAKGPVRQPRSQFEKTQDHLHRLQQRMRALLRASHSHREFDRMMYPDEPDYLLPSAMETLADVFRLERAWKGLREACERSVIQREVLRPCFDHWRFRPGSAGMRVASQHWHASC